MRPTVTHTPTATPGVDSICLAVTDAPLRFRSRFVRATQSILGICAKPRAIVLLNFAIAYACAARAFFGLDFVGLTTMASGFYHSRIGELLLARPNFGVSGLFYLVYVAGLFDFAVLRAFQAGSWATALVNGALLGLVADRTYDMTNLSTPRNWSISVSIVDMA